MNHRANIQALVIIFILCSQSLPAYVGPGTGLTSVGVVLAAIAAVFVTLFGFVWYPVKRLLRRLKNKKKSPDQEDPE